MSNYKLVVGLGNPGKPYQKNRHNIGFMAVGRFVQDNQLAPFHNRPKFKAVVSENSTRQIIAAKPSTYMNNSGQAVASIKHFYKLKNSQIIVVYDDADLKFLDIRIKQGGGSAGHRGVDSIISHIGNDFWRLRLGTGSPPRGGSLEKYVLKNFSFTQKPKLGGLIAEASRQIKLFTTGQLPHKNQ